MPILKTTAGEIDIPEELVEPCPRCEGKGWYNYFPHENKLKTMFYRLIGGPRCLQCGGSGKTLTEQGRALAERKEFEARWEAMKKTEPPGPS